MELVSQVEPQETGAVGSNWRVSELQKRQLCGAASAQGYFQTVRMLSE